MPKGDEKPEKPEKKRAEVEKRKDRLHSSKRAKPCKALWLANPASSKLSGSG
jgi:hypothetical protein